MYTAKMLRDGDQTKRTEEWHRWMRQYWRKRLKCLPQHCTEQEKSALVEWVTLLDEDYPAAVDTGTRGSHVSTRGLELGHLMVPFDRKNRTDARPL